MAASANYLSGATPEKPTAAGMGNLTEGGPFNFQTSTLAKSPVIKSVSAATIMMK